MSGNSSEDSKVFKAIASLGVPGVILFILISTSGLYGAAAYTSSLAALGGPFGMLGGLFVLGLLTMAGPTIVRTGLSGLPKLLDILGKSPEEVRQDPAMKRLPAPIKKKVMDALETIVEKPARKNTDSHEIDHPFWGDFFRRGVPLHPELEGLTPTGNMKKIGPSIGNRVQIDIDWTGNGVRLRPFLVDRETFENEVGVPEAWKDGSEKFLSITLLPAPKAIQKTWSTERQVTETLELYGRIKKYLQARM
ncbi:MAG: hypothetical protein P8K66_07365 [Planctomycetota bacterium]|nr:hypothetical protein [Planctomycetota bacterium]